jgi:hypothetical protein
VRDGAALVGLKPAVPDAPEIKNEEADRVVLPGGHVEQAPDLVLDGAKGAKEEETLELHDLRLAANILDKGPLRCWPPNSRLGCRAVEL